MSHIPVLLPEVIDALAPQNGETYVDGTFGGGGYAMRVLAAADCKLFGIDRDLDAITRAEAMAEIEPRLTPLLGRFGDMDALLLSHGIEAVDGVMLDRPVTRWRFSASKKRRKRQRSNCLPPTRQRSTSRLSPWIQTPARRSTSL